MLHEIPDTTPGSVRAPRRWFQFRLRTLFLLTLVVALLLRLTVGPARQQAAVKYLSENEVRVLYEGSLEPVSPHSVKGWLPRDYFDFVDTVSFAAEDRTAGLYLRPVRRSHGAAIIAKGLVVLGDLKRLRRLDLHATGVANAGLAHLRRVPSLEELDLGGTAVGDEGLAHLAGLTRLRLLNLSGTNVTDAGLAHLQRMRSLEQLNLADTEISDDGLAHIAVGRLRVLDLANTAVTDESLRLLAAGSQLTGLRLAGTKISDAGLLHLHGQLNLARLNLYGTSVTNDCVPLLQNFPLLETIDLRHTQVTPEAAGLLMRASPPRQVHW